MNTRKFTTLAQLLNEAVNVAHTQIEKDLAQSFCFNPLVTNNKFPVSDTYIYYKKQEESVDESEESKEKIVEEVEKISLKLYLAGYTKDNVKVLEDPANNSIIVEGEVKEGNEHFPKEEHVKRTTQGASGRKFRVRYTMIPKFKLEGVTMKDGVLSIDFTPIEDLRVKQINIA